MSLWTRIKRWLMNSDNTEALQKEFELSATALIEACEECCEETDEFLTFLDQFFSELASMRYQIEGIQHLSITETDWSPSDNLPEQVKTIYASIVSVMGQIAAREQMLVSNVKAVNHIHHGLTKVEGLVDIDMVDALKERVTPLLPKSNEQLLAIRTALSQMEKERAVYDSLGALLKDEKQPDLLN